MRTYGIMDLDFDQAHHLPVLECEPPLLGLQGTYQGQKELLVQKKVFECLQLPHSHLLL